MIRDNILFAAIVVMGAVLVGCTGHDGGYEKLTSYAPPPRKTTDIVTHLGNATALDGVLINSLLKKADAPPPDTDDKVVLAEFYRKRGRAARGLGRKSQCLMDLRKSIELMGEFRNKNYHLWIRDLGVVEAESGNVELGVEYLRESIKSNRQLCPTFYMLTKAYYRAGDYDLVIDTAKNGISWCSTHLTGPNLDIWNYRPIYGMRALAYETKGEYAMAEQNIRNYIEIAERLVGFKNGTQYHSNPNEYVIAILWLSSNLQKQGKLAGAEIEARRALNLAYGMCDVDTTLVALAIDEIAKIRLSMGEVDEARKLILTELHALDKLQIQNDSYIYRNARSTLADIMVYSNEWNEAVRQYDKCIIKTETDGQEIDFLAGDNINYHIAKLFSNDAGPSIADITKLSGIYTKLFGDGDYKTQEAIALLAAAYVRNGNARKGLELFSESVPMILEKANDSNQSFATKYRRILLLECYLHALATHAVKTKSGVYQGEVADKTFQAVDALMDAGTGSAIDSACKRYAAMHDDKLRLLIRKEQDLDMEIQALKVALFNQLSLQKGQSIPELANTIKSHIAKLASEKKDVQNQILENFPKYSQLVKPQQYTAADVKSNLRSDEAFVAVYPSINATYVWLITPDHKTIMNVLHISRSELDKHVHDIRKSFSAENIAKAGLEKFRVDEAYYLYSMLLEPFKSILHSFSTINFLVASPLDQIPFSVLITDENDLSMPVDGSFSAYKDMHWLINGFALVRHISVMSFIELRRQTPRFGPRKMFVGFGDPVFSASRMPPGASSELQANGTLNNDGINIRAIRLTKKTSFDDESLASADLSMLSRLPDTAVEISEIGNLLHATPESDFFLRERATETNAKSNAVSDRKVLAFATHALLPGDIDGLHQPALALTSPKAVLSEETEDGLLQMGEIFTLQLNADMVILSACNSGAGAGKGADAISGLGKAFFYAGTRSLLVTMWPVESHSARLLTTGIFRAMDERQPVSRAKALQLSMLQLMDSGKTLGSSGIHYSHPFFWAPFILVGEGSEISN